MTDMSIWARPLGDVAYLLIGAGVGRYMGGRWAWHLAQSGTPNTSIRADMRKGFYRDALGRPTKEAYGYGMTVAFITIFAWPFMMLLVSIIYVLNHEGAQDLLLPGTNEVYEKEQERYNLAMNKNRRLEVEMRNRELEKQLGIGGESLPEVVD